MRFQKRGIDMDILVAIAGWVLGSIALGLLLGQIFRASAEHRHAEEQLLASLQTGAGETTCRRVTAPKAGESAPTAGTG
jgi:hypothetical protein